MAKDPIEVKVRKFPVRVIEKRGPARLVEYKTGAGNLARVVVPDDAIDDQGMVLEDDLNLGIPHGLPWEQLIHLSATPAALAAHLRANGIWTLEDMEANPQAVFGAIQAVYGVDFGRLIQAAHNYKP
jgi:hypothetical protein